MEKFTANSCIVAAWQIFKKRPWLFVGITALVFLISACASFLRTESMHEGMIMDIIGFLFSLFISFYVGFAQTKLFLKTYDSTDTVRIRDLWKIRGFGQYALLSIILGIILIVAYVLLIIPGIILSVVLMFATYILVDTGVTPIEALKESARITKGYRWVLFLLSLELVGLNIIGVVCLIAGLLVTVPLSILATIHAYRTLQNTNSPVVVVV